MEDVPEIVRRKAAAQGPIGLRWLRSLESLVAALARDWGLQIGSTLSGGTDAYVAEATTEDGGLAVLKLGIPTVEDGYGLRTRSVRFSPRAAGATRVCSGMTNSGAPSCWRGSGRS
jgi:hypothetical protein